MKNTFNIISHKLYEFHTIYQIEYFGKIYKCNFNGGLARLEGKRLNETLRKELTNTLEDFFIQEICKNN